jgi:hypothetical protein
MARQYPNNTAQAGLFYSGSPDYVDVDSALSAVDGRHTFATEATANSWADGDVLGVRIDLISAPDANYKIWKASWDATNQYLLKVTEEETVGTLSDGAAVTVTAVLTRAVLLDALMDQVNASGNVQITGLIQKDAVIVVESTTSRTLSASDNGKIIECTNGSATTITLPDSLSGNFHCIVVQKGAGSVTLTVSGTATVNGDTDSIVFTAQYVSAYIYQSASGEWIKPL